MKVCAIFESWNISGGNYPPLRTGQFVNLSFELVPERVSRVAPDEPEKMTHVDHAEYQFCAKILKIYWSDRPLVVAEAENFGFYITSFPESAEFAEADKIWGVGSLSLDSYEWVQFVDHHADAPDLFYKLRVASIYDLSEQKEVETMRDSERGACLVRFDSDNLGGELIPRTCQPASRH